MIPNDPNMLLSYINMQLRDHYRDLEELSEGLDIDIEEVLQKLEAAGYRYDKENNKFLLKQ